MRPPPPPQLGVLQLRGQQGGWGPQLCEDHPRHLARRCEPAHGGGPRAPTLTQPLPCPDPPSLFSSEPVPAPCAAAATAASAPAPAGSAWLSGRCLPLRKPTAAKLVRWPAPRIPPALLPPPSTGSRDGDRSCAANTHPQPGILPTSTIAREVRGSERQFSREPSPWQRLQQEQPVLKLSLGGGLCGGWRIRRHGVERRLWALR